MPRQQFIDDIKLHTDMREEEPRRLQKRKDDDKKVPDTFKGIVTPKEPPKTTVLGRELPHQARLARLVNALGHPDRGRLLAARPVHSAGLPRAAFSSWRSNILSNPPWPWLPASPKSEGNYVFVNKNVVELMALLVLLTLPTGRWLGLDAILSRLWPFRPAESCVVRQIPRGDALQPAGCSQTNA